MQKHLDEIHAQLRRIGLPDVSASLDEEFEPDAGTLVKLQTPDGAYWHLLPGELLELLKALPDGAGSEALKTAIAEKGTNVWEGPAPEDSRDRH